MCSLIRPLQLTCRSLNITQTLSGGVCVEHPPKNLMCLFSLQHLKWFMHSDTCCFVQLISQQTQISLTKSNAETYKWTMKQLKLNHQNKQTKKKTGIKTQRNLESLRFLQFSPGFEEQASVSVFRMQTGTNTYKNKLQRCICEVWCEVFSFMTEVDKDIILIHIILGHWLSPSTDLNHYHTENLAIFHWLYTDSH